MDELDSITRLFFFENKNNDFFRKSSSSFKTSIIYI